MFKTKEKKVDVFCVVNQKKFKKVVQNQFTKKDVEKKMLHFFERNMEHISILLCFTLAYA